MTNVSISNTAPFTVEGATGGTPTVLEPSNPGDVTSGPAEISGNRFTSDSAIDGGALGLIETNLGAGAGAQVTGNTFGGSGPAGNTAVNAGGAVWSELRSGQPLTLSGNTFEGNSVTATGEDAGQGGAVWAISGLGKSTAPSVTQSRNVFIDNSVDFTGTTAPTNPHPLGGGRSGSRV